MLNSYDFEKTFNDILLSSGTQGDMTISYLKDVSVLLAIVRAVRQGDFSLNMAAQREMVKLCFSLNHVNYARYLSYQHVYFTKLETENRPAIFNLKTRDMGGSLTGSNFCQSMEIT